MTMGPSSNVGLLSPVGPSIRDSGLQGWTKDPYLERSEYSIVFGTPGSFLDTGGGKHQGLVYDISTWE